MNPLLPLNYQQDFNYLIFQSVKNSDSGSTMKTTMLKNFLKNLPEPYYDPTAESMNIQALQITIYNIAVDKASNEQSSKSGSADRWRSIG